MEPPTMDTGITCDLRAHTEGREGGEYNGGWFTELTIGGSPIEKTLESKVDGAKSPIKCAAWWTLMRVEASTILWFSLTLDAVTNESVNAAGTLASFIGAPDEKISFKGTALARNTKKDHAKKDLLTSASIEGYVWRQNGRLLLSSGRHFETSTGKFQEFALGIAVKQSLDLQVNFGGTVNRVWTVAPTSK
jgi:hypothetical protein